MYQLFNSGKMAMEITGPWQLPEFVDGKIDYGVAPLPTFGGEHDRRSRAPTRGRSSTTATARSKAAIEFVPWLNAPEQESAGDRGGQPAAAQGHGGPAELSPTTRRACPGSRCSSTPSSCARVRPTIPAYPQVSQAIGQAIVVVLLGSSFDRRGRAAAGGQGQRGAGVPGGWRRWPSPAAPPRPLAQRVLGETPTAWLFVAPAVVIILGLSLVPMGWSLLLCFQHGRPDHAGRVGRASNYDALLDDPTFRDAVQHTLLYTALFVPLSIAGGLGIALVLNRRIRFIGIYRTLVFVPFIMSAPRRACCSRSSSTRSSASPTRCSTPSGCRARASSRTPARRCGCSSLIGLWGGIGFRS